MSLGARANAGLAACAPTLMGRAMEMTTFGMRLRRAREAREVSLQRIATATKISVRALEAVERNDFSRLPGGIYTRAFVRAYAEEVGLDPDEALQDFLAQCPADAAAVPTRDPATIDEPRSAGRELTPWFRAAGVVVVAVLLVLAGIRWWSGRVPSSDGRRGTVSIR